MLRPIVVALIGIGLYCLLQLQCTSAPKQVQVDNDAPPFEYLSEYGFFKGIVRINSQ